MGGGGGALPHTRARCHGSHLRPRALALPPALGVRPGLTVGSSRWPLPSRPNGDTQPRPHVLAVLGCITHLWGAGCPREAVGQLCQSPAKEQPGQSLACGGCPGKLPGGLPLNWPLPRLVPHALAAPAAPLPPRVPPPRHPAARWRLHRGAGWEEAPQSSRTPNGGRLISGPSGPPHPYLPRPLALAGLAAPPRPPPAPAGSALGGGRLAACPLDPF